MAEKVIAVVIKVDLQCYRCYRKIRKLLCSLPEIRDQMYDEKQNAVKITVVSCCPERILKKICHKGGKSVEKIEIVSGDKKKEPEKKKEGAEKAKDGVGEKESKPEKKKEGTEKAKDSPGEKKKDEPEKKGKDGKPEKEAEKKTAAKEPEKKKKEGEDKPKDKEVEKKQKEPLPVPVPAAVAGYPSIFPPVYPLQAYYDPYNQQPVHVGPVQYHQSHGMPDYYGPSISNGNRGTYYGYQYDYFTDENPSSCTVM